MHFKWTNEGLEKFWHIILCFVRHLNFSFSYFVADQASFLRPRHCVTCEWYKQNSNENMHFQLTRIHWKLNRINKIIWAKKVWRLYSKSVTKNHQPENVTCKNSSYLFMYPKQRIPALVLLAANWIVWCSYFVNTRKE